MGERVLIRTCTSTRPPECGVVQFGSENFSGCSLICSYDGCNSAEPPPQASVYSNDNNRFQNQNYNEMVGTAPRETERMDTRTRNRSILSFGRILISLLMMRNSGNKP